jgi:ethanolamine ammonia-lyase small subunit
MSDDPKDFRDPITRPAWENLRSYTSARIALGRAGAGLPTSAHLAFQLAHARARDAVYSTLDRESLIDTLRERGETAVSLHSAATDRREYLLRPDLGRRLSDTSRAHLASLSGSSECDVVFVLADGLSATAVNAYALALVEAVLPTLRRAGWRIGPFSLVEQGRVAVGDEIAQLLMAHMVVILLGERPGLSASDSLGVYLTWHPKAGVTTDAERNCLSNVREGGLSIAAAASRLLYLMTESRRRQLSGVDLKEQSDLSSSLIPD